MLLLRIIVFVVVKMLLDLRLVVIYSLSVAGGWLLLAITVIIAYPITSDSHVPR